MRSKCMWRDAQKEGNTCMGVCVWGGEGTSTDTHEHELLKSQEDICKKDVDIWIWAEEM